MHPQQDFIVIDTEGKNELREIAIIDSKGKLIYEAFAKEHHKNDERVLNLKPLREIVVDFLKFPKTKLIIFHYAKHDIQVLKNSCRKVGLPWKNLTFECSCELAKASFPGLASYSLEYLSKHLNLKVNQSYFDVNLAHIARYDAEFTYQLYLKLMAQAPKAPLLDTLRDKPNPFGSSRVDNPFQDHVDFKEIYQDEFEILKSVITDIKHDKNHQSKGAIVIGEPGSGKTHLMMRLAKELLKVNRLLFIRQPNNPDSVLYHTYSRILESFIQKVPDSNYTQLEHLLANSFVKLISTTRIISLNNRDREILSAVQKGNLKIYEILGAEGTQRKREYWQHIERRTNEWWANEYGVAGYSAQIIKGIVKYCSYSDSRKKEIVTRWLAANELTQEETDFIGLNNWKEEISKEEFSLQAISVFSKLSLLDEPLIIVFDQLEGLGLKHNESLLVRFGEAVKEIFTHVPNSLIILNLFPDRWEQFKEIFDDSILRRISQYKVRLQMPIREKIQKILQIKAQEIGLNIENLFNGAELEIIFNQQSIGSVLNRASDYYQYKVHNVPLPESSSSPSKPIVSEAVQERLTLLENEIAKLQKKAGSSFRADQEDMDALCQTLQELDNDFTDWKQVVTNLVEDVQSLYIKTDELEQKTKELDKKLKKEKREGEGEEVYRNPLILYLQRQKTLIEQEYTEPKIISDSDDVGKLRTIAQIFKDFKYFELYSLRLGGKKLPEHLVIQSEHQSIAIGFLQINGGSFTARIQNWNELVLRHKKDTSFKILRDQKPFKILRDRRQPGITGRVGRDEIEKLNNSSNGSFIIMEQEDRIKFELIYKLIIDIQERNVYFDLEDALPDLIDYLDNYWLINLFEQFENI
jgi:DNA polymerase III epsilon subunit-like protein